MSNRKYTQNEIKSFITETLVELEHIFESKYITKTEYKKFNKFFNFLLRQTKKKKNPYYFKDNPKSEKYIIQYPVFHTYEDAKCTGRYITLNTDNVPDLNLKEIYKEFPLLIETHNKLISIKQYAKSGRRPKDLEKNYEAERIKKAALEDKATCGICHNYWEQVNMNGQKNILADHGFFLGNGQRNNECFGSRYLAWERSPVSKIEYIAKVLKPTLDKVIKSKPSQATVDVLIKWVKQYKIEMLEYYKLSRTDRLNTEHPLAPEYKLSGQRIGYRLANIKNLNLSLITEVWFEYKTKLENDIKYFQHQIDNWKLQPTPKERKIW